MNHSRVTIRMLEETDTTRFVFQVFWLIGLTMSLVCLFIQLSLFIFVRSSRKTDQKVLAQITLTRILVTFCEYYLLYIPTKTILSNDIMYTLYFSSDFALMCLMLVFSINLYDKIVVVFPTRQLKLIAISIVVWSISLVLGMAGVYIIKYHMTKYFSIYCHVIHASAKFVIVAINMLLFFKIFYVAYKRGRETNRNVKDVIKTACVALFLVSTVCLQILITDLTAYKNDASIVLTKTFCVINSFHALPITALFIFILRSSIEGSIVRAVTVRLSEIVTRS